MKSYAIYDEDSDKDEPLGYLFHYEKADAVIIELREDLNEWDAPLLFQGLVKKGVYTIPKEISRLWVEERVIPSSRQNIGSILRNHKLKEYNEMALLALSKGRCSQDSCYIKEVSAEEIPEKIQKRSARNVTECFPSGDGRIVCCYKDNTVNKIDLKKLLPKYRDIAHILKNEDLFRSVKVGVGGYSITFNDSIEISAVDLRANGKALPLAAEDFISFARNNLADATLACDLLQCSRQNLSYLVKTGKIRPIICGTKENFYTKGDIERLRND